MKQVKEVIENLSIRKVGAQNRENIIKVIENLKPYYNVTTKKDYHRVKGDIKKIFQDDSESSKPQLEKEIGEEQLFKTPKTPAPKTREQKSKFLLLPLTFNT